MIQLIEEEYPREQRDTASKMSEIIEREFNIKVAPSFILRITGIDDDYEREQRKIQYGTDCY
jgi:hypothetical protein